MDSARWGGTNSRERSSPVTTEGFQAGIERLESRMDARFEASRAELYRVSLIQGGIIIGAVVALVE